MTTTITAAEEPDDHRSTPEPNPFWRPAPQPHASEELEDDEFDPRVEIRRWRDVAKATGLRLRAAEAANRDLEVRISGVDWESPGGRLLTKAMGQGVVEYEHTAEGIRALAQLYEIPMRGES